MQNLYEILIFSIETLNFDTILVILINFALGCQKEVKSVKWFENIEC